MPEYWTLAGFEALYLEDSWVLDIIARPGILEFVLDVVLRESHPSYQAPLAGAQYCYRRGVVRFERVSSLLWDAHDVAPAVDASGERDYGSVDAFQVADESYVIEGDFGRIAVESAAPSVVLSESASRLSKRRGSGATPMR